MIIEFWSGRVQIVEHDFLRQRVHGYQDKDENLRASKNGVIQDDSQACSTCRFYFIMNVKKI